MGDAAQKSGSQATSLSGGAGLAKRRFGNHADGEMLLEPWIGVLIRCFETSQNVQKDQPYEIVAISQKLSTDPFVLAFRELRQSFQTSK